MNIAQESDYQAGIQQYVGHLEHVARSFNDYAQAQRLGVRLSTGSAIAAVSDLRTSLNKIAPYLTRPDDTGVLHPEQLVTAIDAMNQMLLAPDQAGLILGALQSGKTTTGLALQLLGPVYYLLTGKKLYPFYLLTSQTSHQAQTTHELTRFLQYYGDLKFELDDSYPNASGSVTSDALHPLFKLAPTLSMYRDHVLNHVENYFTVPKVEDYVWRRAWGENINRIANRVETLADKGFIPLMIIDEPQFGASDRIEIAPSGDILCHPCVFAKIFDEIAKRLKITVGQHVFIALSATPFEVNDLQNIWKVQQRLGAGYSGFNFFAGRVIDAQVEINPPRTMSFSQFGSEVGVPFLPRINLQAYDSVDRFDKMRKRLGYTGDWEQYRKETEAAIVQMLRKLRDNHPGETFGVCMRTINNNRKTDDLLSALDLPDFDIVHYYGLEASRKSVKQILAEREVSRQDKPFLIMVTSRARLGDAFPTNVKYFIEFADRFSDLNSMMQGLIGRACGYGKSSTVVLSEKNALLMRTVIDALGGYFMDPSRHSMVVGGKRRGRPSQLIVAMRNSNDARLEAFFKAIDEQLIAKHVDAPCGKIVVRHKGRRRTGPVLQIAQATGFFVYLESKEAHDLYFKDFSQFRIARGGDNVQNPREIGKFFSYRLDENGDCRYSFREWKGQGHTGLRARGRSGGDDDSTRDEEHDHLEPQILLEKYDAQTGEAIVDHLASGPRIEGMWRARGIALPLLHPVQEYVVGTAAYPIETSPFSNWMNDEEREARQKERDRRAVEGAA